MCTFKSRYMHLYIDENGKVASNNQGNLQRSKKPRKDHSFFVITGHAE